MHLRPTTTADIPRCTTIIDNAYVNDELYNFLAANRTAHPLQWRQSALKAQHAKLCQANAWSFVCVADADDNFAPPGEILGCARWTRRPSKEDAATDPWIRRLSLAERVEGWLRWAELQWEERLRINPARAWDREDAFMRSIVTSTAFKPVRGATHWYLDHLAVAPEYQRRGVGKKLVQWGLQRAEAETRERMKMWKEPVPVALIGSTMGFHLYRSLGFKVVGWEDASFLDVPAEGGSTMVWDPLGYWIQDVEYEPPMTRGVVEAAWTTRDPE
jgi:GNAT superfamily N-acetyltransferase